MIVPSTFIDQIKYHASKSNPISTHMAIYC